MWYAQRSSVNARSDEDSAMAHKREGGFYEKTDAHAALISMVEREIRAWDEMGIPDTGRLARIRERLAIDGETDVTEDGLRFNIYSTVR